MKNEPLFEVLKNGKPVMHTYEEACIYDKNTIRAMKAAGYTVIDRRKKKLGRNNKR